MAIDIHNFAKQYARAEILVRESSVSARNKALILGYRDACLIHNTCRRVRLIRVLIILRLCAEDLRQDFDTVTRADVERLIAALIARDLKPATMATYKAVLKRFLSWVFCPAEFPRVTNVPACVSWMTVHVHRRDHRPLRRSDLLTPEDVAKLIATATHPRDKAFVAALWEGGERISEIGNLLIGAITKHPYGFLVDLKGKTGGRTTLLVSSAPYLAQWLAIHPQRDDPQAPLWVNEHSHRPKPIGYRAFAIMLRRLYDRAGIYKPSNCHAVRHARATHLLANGLMSDAQARQQFGWSQSSTMLATYAHLVDGDVHAAILRENDIITDAPKVDELKPVPCRRCNRMNAPTAPFCIQCAQPLTEAAMYAPAEAGNDQLVMLMVNMMAERGLLNDAVDAIHKAGLGKPLKRLAEQPTTG